VNSVAASLINCVFLSLVLTSNASSQTQKQGWPSFPSANVNIDEPGRIPYRAYAEADQQNGGCNSIGQCYLYFKAVPAGSRVVIQQITAYIASVDVLPDTSKIFVELGDRYDAAVFHFATAPFAGNYSPVGMFAQPTFVTLDAGQEPSVFLYTVTSNFQDAEVNLIGYQLDCTVATCEPLAGGSSEKSSLPSAPKAYPPKVQPQKK
jgi:hypothetical protein